MRCGLKIPENRGKGANYKFAANGAIRGFREFCEFVIFTRRELVVGRHLATLAAPFNTPQFDDVAICQLVYCVRVRCIKTTARASWQAAKWRRLEA